MTDNQTAAPPPTLSQEADSMSVNNGSQTETTASGTESVTKVKVSTDKKNNKKIIIMVAAVVLTLCICCVVAFAALFAAGYNQITNSEESQVTRELFTALDEGDTATVRQLTSEQVYDDLYLEYSDGSSIAGLLENNLVDVKFLGYQNDGEVTVLTIVLNLNQNQDVFSDVNQVELEQSASGNWVVTYIGSGY